MRLQRVEHDLVTKQEQQQSSIVYMSHIFFIHSPVNGYLGGFHVLTTVNGPSVNIWKHVSFQTMFFSRHVSSSMMPGTQFLFSPISCEFHPLCCHVLSSGSGKAPDFTEFTFSDGTIYI